MSDEEHFGRRIHDRIAISMKIVDDEDPNALTISELKELKRLAHMSKTARFVMAAMIGVVSFLGLPAIFDFVRAHWR